MVEAGLRGEAPALAPLHENGLDRLELAQDVARVAALAVLDGARESGPDRGALGRVEIDARREREAACPGDVREGVAVAVVGSLEGARGEEGVAEAL